MSAPLLLAVTLFAGPGPLVVKAGTTGDLDCAGRATTILGEGTKVRLVGSCPSIEILGNRNEVSVSGATRLKLVGRRNVVTHVGPRPAIDDKGSMNEVLAPDGKPLYRSPGWEPAVAASAAPSPTPTARNISLEVPEIRSDGAKREVPCLDGDYEISGNDNVIRYTGVCTELRVSGDRNRVQLDEVSRVRLSGSDNQIFWKAATDDAPEILDSGRNNRVLHAK